MRDMKFNNLNIVEGHKVLSESPKMRFQKSLGHSTSAGRKRVLFGCQVALFARCCVRV